MISCSQGVVSIMSDIQSQDTINHSHTSHHSTKHHHHHHKRKHMARNIVIVLLCFVFAMSVTTIFFINIFLNKINYLDELVSKTNDPSVDESVQLPDEFSKYNDDVEANYAKTGIYSQENVVNILICGIDEGANDKYYGHSDSMMILSVNKNDNTIRLASLSRAVYVKIAGHKNTRLNAAYLYGGPKLLIDTIQNNYKIKIDNYVSFDFEAFEKIIDIFGGIDVYLTNTEAKGVERSLFVEKVYDSSFSYAGAGTYHLDGKSALMFSRLRYIDSDRERTGRQRKVVEKVFEKLKKISVTDAIEIANKTLPLVTTDMTKTVVLSQCAQIPKYISWKTEQTVIPDKSSDIIEVDGLGVLFVDWDETVNYTKSFFYPSK